MKRQLMILFLFVLFSFCVFAEEVLENEENIDNTPKRVEYDLSGFTLELSYFNFVSMGVGYNWGSFETYYGHFFASDYGFYIGYKTVKNEIHLRLYYNIYGGSAGMLLGASGIMTSDFNSITFGISPHIGVGFPGMKLFYRYNLCLDSKFNSHEFVLALLFDPFNENRRR